MNLLIQRFKSKTYWVALIGALLTVAEVNSGFLSNFLPVFYRPYIIMFWPVIMLMLREMTTVALADK
jgi:uncharacterized membrane protein